VLARFADGEFKLIRAHLVPYYREGALYLPRTGIWGSNFADEEYRVAVAPADTLQHRDPYRIAATTWGFLLAAALAAGYRISGDVRYAQKAAELFAKGISLNPKKEKLYLKVGQAYVKRM
jgi:hypothetical protein